MKMWKKLLTSVFAASVLIGLSTGTVLAAETGEVLEKEAYTYKVTFYSGNQGDITATEEELKEYIVVTDAENVAKEAAISKDADKVVVTGLNAGDKVGIMFHRDKTVENDSVSFLLMNEDCPTIVKINVDLREY